MDEEEPNIKFEKSEEEEYDFSYDRLCEILRPDDPDNANIEKLYEGCNYIPSRHGLFYNILLNFTPEEKQKIRKNMSTEERNEKERSRKEGLKFHISLPEDDSKVDKKNDTRNRLYYKRGWDIIQKILREHKVNHFKIAANEIRMSDKDDKELDQRGKDVTIYAHYQLYPILTLKDWLEIVKEITEALIKADIPPGLKPVDTGERAESYLERNDYVSYRYDVIRDFVINKEIVPKTWAEINNYEYKNQGELSEKAEENSNTTHNNDGYNDDSCCNSCKIS